MIVEPSDNSAENSSTHQSHIYDVQIQDPVKQALFRTITNAKLTQPQKCKDEEQVPVPFLCTLPFADQPCIVHPQ